MDDDDLIEDEIDLSEVAGYLVSNNPSLIEPVIKKRAQKVSKAPIDWDPFEEQEKTPEGYHRPDQKCWVDSSIARPVEMSELSPLWRQNPIEMGTLDRRHRLLATLVASVNGEYYVRRKGNCMWVVKKKASEVKNILWNEWGGDLTPLNIRKDTIDTFFSDTAYIVLDQTAYIPGAGAFVAYRGKNCLNTYYERPMAFPMNKPTSPETTLLMEMVIKNLLNHQVGDMDDWLDEITNGEESEIRWLFHWLASQYQRPGKFLPTALWFVGPAQGIGKGLFASDMKIMLGRSNVKDVSAEEFKGDWTDFLTDASLFVLDEVDFSSRKEANNKLKRLVGNETLSARKRNVGEFEVPSVANYIFTTNNIRPLTLDRDDRRNTFFETCGTAEAKERADAYYRLGASGRRTAWEGLVEILNSIEIDDRLISRALMTDVKLRMIEAGLEPFLEWFFSDDIVEKWPVGEFAPIEWITTKYIEWAQDNAFKGCTTSNYCRTKLSESFSEGLVSGEGRKVLNDGSKRRGYVRIDRNNPNPVFKDCDAIPSCRANKNLVEAQERVASLKKTSKLRAINGGAA